MYMCAISLLPLYTLFVTLDLLSSVGGAYTKLGQECVKFGVGVELFAFPSDYCDVATLSSLAQTMGGGLHLYPRLQVHVTCVCIAFREGVACHILIRVFVL